MASFVYQFQKTIFQTPDEISFTGSVYTQPEICLLIHHSQIKGPTLANMYGLKTTPVNVAANERQDKPDLTILSVEVFGQKRYSIFLYN